MVIDYDQTGRISNTSLGNMSTSQNYDSSGALSYYEADYGGSSIFQTSYQRDSLNRISILTEVSQGQTTVKKYAYDIAGRLSQVWQNDTIVSAYTYDANGNRISKWTPSEVDSGKYDAQDRMLSYSTIQSHNGSTTQSSSFYVYSSSGELQKKITGSDTTNYTYDYFGNLITVILPNNDRIDYVIDGQNRRIGKKLNGQIVKKWIYSGQLSPSAELDSAGNVIAQFVGPLMIKNGHGYQLVTDHLESVRIVVDVNSGDVVQKLEYDEYGNIISDSNPDFEPFGYAGGLYDSQTKLVRFGARDYDASIGRWTCKDPIGFGRGETGLYGYVGNDPINWIDPSGLVDKWYNWKIEGKLIERAKEKGIELSKKAAVDLRKEMRENELDILRDDNKGEKEQLDVLKNIKDRVLKDIGNQYSADVKEELKRLSQKLDPSQKSDTCMVKYEKK
jgi:RHS repeat-associated protein